MLEKLKEYAKEHKKGLICSLFILFLGMAYFIIILLTPLRIPCLFNKITGFACPGCGITTMISRLAHFEFKAALSENYAISVLFPIFFVIFALRLTLKPKCLQNDGLLFNTILFSSIALLVIFGILRNVSGFDFLLPSYMR